MWPSLVAELAMNLICLRLDRRPDVGAWLVLGVSPNIYKLKATSCGLFASGNRVRSPMSGMGCSFRLRPRWETPSHSDRKFRVAFSARALNWKLHPTPKANSWTHFPKPHPFGKCFPLCIHPANACECVVQDGLVIGVMENVTPNACHGCAYECQEKSLENFEAFTFVLFCTKDRERRSYSPKTAFLAAAAMLSRSSLVGWSFAATQLSSSILNRALSGSCSSMAS